MTGPELIAKIIHRLLIKEGYSNIALNGNVVHILKNTNPEYFTVTVGVEKQEKPVEDKQNGTICHRLH